MPFTHCISIYMYYNDFIKQINSKYRFKEDIMKKNQSFDRTFTSYHHQRYIRNLDLC